MDDDPLQSLADYSRFVVELAGHPAVERSTLRVWSDSPYTGLAEGELFFPDQIRLRIREELDFDAALIASYGYEVYRGEERLYWYDDFPHPNDPILAPTFPHHKHVPPDIRHHRILAPEMSFSRPNLRRLIQEIEELIQQERHRQHK
jgi:hypothetical protein